MAAPRCDDRRQLDVVPDREHPRRPRPHRPRLPSAAGLDGHVRGQDTACGLCVFRPWLRQRLFYTMRASRSEADDLSFYSHCPAVLPPTSYRVSLCRNAECCKRLTSPHSPAMLLLPGAADRPSALAAAFRASTHAACSLPPCRQEPLRRWSLGARVPGRHVHNELECIIALTMFYVCICVTVRYACMLCECAVCECAVCVCVYQ